MKMGVVKKREKSVQVVNFANEGVCCVKRSHDKMARIQNKIIRKEDCVLMWNLVEIDLKLKSVKIAMKMRMNWIS